MSDARFLRVSDAEKVSKQRLRGLGVIWMFLTGFLLVCPMLWIASLRGKLVDYGYKLNAVRQEKDALLQEQARLKAELAHLKQPELVFRKMQRMRFVPLPLEKRYLVHTIPNGKSNPDDPNATILLAKAH